MDAILATPGSSQRKTSEMVQFIRLFKTYIYLCFENIWAFRALRELCPRMVDHGIANHCPDNEVRA